MSVHSGISRCLGFLLLLPAGAVAAADASQAAPALLAPWIYWPIALLLMALVWLAARPVRNPWARGVIWGAVASLLLTPVSLGTGDESLRASALEHALAGVFGGDGARASLAVTAAFKLWPLFAIGCGLMERVLAPRHRRAPRRPPG